MRNDKNKALNLRRQGNSYNEISRQLYIPKSTLSYWFSENPELSLIKSKIIARSKKTWAKNITLYNINRSKKIRQDWIKKQDRASLQIKPINQYELKILGTALYWAEGYKKTNSTVVFCNSDPDMIKLMIKFLHKICQIDKSKLKAQVQIHPNISEKSAKKYWSKISGISLKNFRKSLKNISKSSQKKRNPHTLPYGTFRIQVNDVKLVNKIKGWIKGVIDNIN